MRAEVTVVISCAADEVIEPIGRKPARGLTPCFFFYLIMQQQAKRRVEVEKTGRRVPFRVARPS